LRKRYVFLLVAVCFLVVPLYAQQSAAAQQNTADEMEMLLELSAVTYGQAARFVLEAADEAVLSSADEAFAFAAEKNWLPKNASANAEARLDGIAMLIMHSFALDGGAMYTFAANPHYSYRELTQKKIIQGKADPAMKTPGNFLLFMVGRVLSYLEAEDLAQQEALVRSIIRQLRRMGVYDADVRLTDEGITISLFHIQFLANSTDLTDDEKPKLDTIAKVLSKIKARNILIGGHAAMAGTEEGRVEISLGRAQSVASYLISTGARSEDEVSIIGYGGERPLTEGDSPESMAENRRVEITILE
jgi:outer membrane protein OmpA-like peptidoglycan-associated protein